MWYVKDRVVDIQFHHGRDYFDGFECLVCDFLLTTKLVILGRRWIKKIKVTFNKETQVLRLYNHDVWYRLRLKHVNKVLLVVIGSVQNSMNKTEKSADAVKEEPKIESSENLELSNEEDKPIAS